MIGFSTHHFFDFENAFVIFLLLDCTENWIFNIGFGYIVSPRLLPMLKLGTILLKNVLNVSASSSLFVTVLLLYLNVMHSLWKTFSDKRGPTVLKHFCYQWKFCCLSFRKSLSYFLAKYSRIDYRDFYYRDFSLRSFFYINICFEVLSFS